MRPSNLSFKNSPAENAPSVVSGQQCALLGGSLLTLSKIMGVVKLAEEKKLRPVFWVETNDSDWQEVNLIHFQDIAASSRSLEWMPASMAGKNFSIGSAIIDNEAIAVIKQFFAQLPPTPHTAYLKQTVLNCHKTGNTMANATIKLLKTLLRPLLPKDFVFFNPQSEEFLNFSRPFLLKEASKTPKNAQCPFFIKKNQERVAVFKNLEGNFVTRRDEKVDFTKYALLPHLKTRSILQDAYFNAQYYIAGPAEKKYLRALRPRYRLHQVAPAKVMQRMQLAVISQTQLKSLQKIEHEILRSQLNRPSIDMDKTSVGIDKTGIAIKDIALLLSFYGEEVAKKYLLRETAQFNNISLRHKLQFNKQAYMASLAKHFPQNLLRGFEKQLYKRNKILLGKTRANIKQQKKKSLNMLGEMAKSLHPAFPAQGSAMVAKRKRKSAAQERVFTMVQFFNLYGNDIAKKILQNYRFNDRIKLIM